jgi:hypothetical protein
MISLPSGLIQKTQYDYIDTKYKDGTTVFPSLDNDTINSVISSFLSWAETSGYIADGKLDLSFISADHKKQKRI